MSVRRRAASLGLVLWTIGALAAGCARPAPEPRPGDEFVLARKERVPLEVRVERETWTLADTSGGLMRWRVAVDGAPPRVVRTTRADLAAGLPAVRRGRRLAAGDVTVRVPSGTFRCRRFTRTFEEGGGRVMDVDEWWARGVPVPVQRWTRWSGLPDRLRRTPPARDADLVPGSELVVLERAPRR